MFNLFFDLKKNLLLLILSIFVFSSYGAGGGSKCAKQFSKNLLKTNIEDYYSLNKRVRDALSAQGVNSVGDLVKNTKEDLLNMKGLGQKSVDLIANAVSEKDDGLSLGMQLPAKAKKQTVKAKAGSKPAKAEQTEKPPADTAQTETAPAEADKPADTAQTDTGSKPAEAEQTEKPPADTAQTAQAETGSKPAKAEQTEKPPADTAQTETAPAEADKPADTAQTDTGSKPAEAEQTEKPPADTAQTAQTETGSKPAKAEQTEKPPADTAQTAQTEKPPAETAPAETGSKPAEAEQTEKPPADTAQTAQAETTAHPTREEVMARPRPPVNKQTVTIDKDGNVTLGKPGRFKRTLVRGVETAERILNSQTAQTVQKRAISAAQHVANYIETARQEVNTARQGAENKPAETEQTAQTATSNFNINLGTEFIDLGVRVGREKNVYTIEGLVRLTKEDILNVNGVDPVHVDRLEEFLKSHGLSFGMTDAQIAEAKETAQNKPTETEQQMAQTASDKKPGRLKRTLVRSVETAESIFNSRPAQTVLQRAVAVAQHVVNYIARTRQEVNTAKQMEKQAEAEQTAQTEKPPAETAQADTGNKPTETEQKPPAQTETAEPTQPPKTENDFVMNQEEMLIFARYTGTIVTSATRREILKRLKQEGLHTYQDLARKTRSELLNIKGIFPLHIDSIEAILNSRNLSLGMTDAQIADVKFPEQQTAPAETDTHPTREEVVARQKQQRIRTQTITIDEHGNVIPDKPGRVRRAVTGVTQASGTIAKPVARLAVTAGHTVTGAMASARDKAARRAVGDMNQLNAAERESFVQQQVRHTARNARRSADRISEDLREMDSTTAETSDLSSEQNKPSGIMARLKNLFTRTPNPTKQELKQRIKHLKLAKKEADRKAGEEIKEFTAQDPSNKEEIKRLEDGRKILNRIAKRQIRAAQRELSGKPPNTKRRVFDFDEDAQESRFYREYVQIRGGSH